MAKKQIISLRVPMSEQSPQERIHNFAEVTLGYTPEQAMEEAKRCLYCANPTCMQGCPVDVNIPVFLKRIGEGDFKGAIQVIKETDALPAITGRVCPQETQCEGSCILCNKYEPVSIGRLERFAADWEFKEGLVSGVPKVQPVGKSVAVVGSGPAGLTVAVDLARLGYRVTIFEALHASGGVLTYGIPEFRLPKGIVRREVDYVRSLGVEIQLDFIVGYTGTVDELLETYAAVFLGTGAGLPWFLGVPGETLSGVYSANEYLTRSNLMKAYRFPEYDTPIAAGRRVITIGGGNTALDAARTALRLGAEESTLVYRRSRAEMPARLEELEHAEQEGVQFCFLTTPLGFHGQEGHLVGLECLRNELGAPDISGRRRPVPVTGSNFRLEADVAIVAIGQSPSPIISKTTADLQTGKEGIIVVDPTNMKTSKKGVFAAGDVITGGATVILAMGQAKKAARSMHAYLQTGVWNGPN